MLGELTGDKRLRSIFDRGLDVHAATAALLFHLKLKGVSELQRAHGKTTNFAVLFGAGAKKISSGTGVSMVEAARILQQWYKSFSSVGPWKADIEEQAMEWGYIANLFGRRRRITITGRNRSAMFRALRQFVNFPIQSGVYDLVMTALTIIGEEMERRKMASKLILQVHDELVADCHPREVDDVAHLFREVMVNINPYLEEMFGFTLEVPLAADVKVGPNWRDQEAYF